MAVSRPLTPREERRLVRQSRRGPARNRALITAQQFLGFRISEILALRIGHVFCDGMIREHVALPPRFLKGHYGSTRMVPIGAKFRRALEHYFRSRSRPKAFRPNEPLFPSSHRLLDGSHKSIGRSTAEKIIKRALSQQCTTSGL
jgi:integrase